MTGPCLARPVVDLKAIGGHEFRLDGEAGRPGPEQVADSLHPLERDRLVHYRLPKRRLEWLAGRLCAKAALATHLASRLEPSRLLIEPDGQGRPRAHGCPAHLSISHSQRRALAVASDQPVGVDTELHARLGASSLELVLGAEEIACTSRRFRCPPARARTVVWCLKEARFKSQGLGNFYPLARHWRLRAWTSAYQPIWEPGSEWSCAPTGHQWQVIATVDDEAATVAVHAVPDRVFQCVDATLARTHEHE